MLVLRTVVAFFCALPLILPMIGVPLPGWIQLTLASVVQWFGGFPFYVGTWKALKEKQIGMDALVALGTTAAYGYSIFRYPHELYFETSAFLISFILLGKVFENRAYKNAASGMQALLKMQPKHAVIKRGDSFVSIPTEEVVIGDIVAVKPGESLPVDGEVIGGASTVDESMLTGESLPISKKSGDTVFAGTINKEGRLELRATRLGLETSLGRIIRLTQEAQHSKPPIQKLADTVSSYFIPAVVAVSIATFLVWWAVGDPFKGLMSSVAVLVIACPCALGLATPTVIMVGVAAAAKRGILIKDAAGLERAATAETILIDKTGTVTEGKAVVQEVIGDIRLAAALAQHSEHPYSRAIVEYAKDTTIPSCENFTSHPGKGVSGSVDGVDYFLGADPSGVALYRGSEKIGTITFADSIKSDAKEAIARLHALGRKLILLSGDREEEVKRVADDVGMDGFLARVLPEEKASKVEELQKESHVAMVGDGVNDAPALQKADVGFAVGSGTDVAMESASVGLMRSTLPSLADAIELSLRMRRKIRQNLFFAFIYNIIGIPIAAFGLLNPIIAGLAMAMSSISVVLNALTLSRREITSA